MSDHHEQLHRQGLGLATAITTPDGIPFIVIAADKDSLHRLLTENRVLNLSPDRLNPDKFRSVKTIHWPQCARGYRHD